MGTLATCSLQSWLCVSVFSSPWVLKVHQNQNHARHTYAGHTTTEVETVLHLTTLTEVVTVLHLTSTITECLVAWEAHPSTHPTTTEVLNLMTQDALGLQNTIAVTGVMALIVDATVNSGDGVMENIGTQFF